jgi:hypothetical protein
VPASNVQSLSLAQLRLRRLRAVGPSITNHEKRVALLNEIERRTAAGVVLMADEIVLGIVAWLIAVLIVLSWMRAAAIGDEAMARALRERRRHARRHR